MFTPLRGLKLGRRAVVVGFVLAGAGATAAAAAGGAPIWQGARPFVVPADETSSTDPPLPPTTAPPTTTSPTAEPVSTGPAVTEPGATESVITEAVVVPEPAQPSQAEPPATEPAVAEPAPPEPAPEVVEPAAEPAVTEPPVTEAPAPAAPKPSDNVVPATLNLSCALAADGGSSAVSCSWFGDLPQGFASFVLLRGDPDGKGRVPYRSGDPGSTSFLDHTASAGSHSYVLVALDAADHPLAHSNMVLVQIAAP